MTREIVKNSHIRYINDLNQLHHEGDKPSYIGFDGNIYFGKKYKFHRKGKPSIIYPYGSLEYFEDHMLKERVEI